MTNATSTVTSTAKYIEFKTKTFPVIQDDNGAVRTAIRLKARLARIDCNLKPHEHTYFNSDLFPAMLNETYRKIVGDRDYLYLDSLPEGVTVDTSKFLAVVTIALPASFKR